MIFLAVLAALSTARLTSEAAGNVLLCSAPSEIAKSGGRRVTAMIEFDGLEHAFLSGMACQSSKSFEIDGGFSLPSQEGKKLYDRVIASAKKSKPGFRLGVKFVGIIAFHQGKAGEINVRIVDVAYSEIKEIRPSA